MLQYIWSQWNVSLASLEYYIIAMSSYCQDLWERPNSDPAGKRELKPIKYRKENFQEPYEFNF